MLAFHLSTFKVDATPPAGHPLCGGWIKPVVGVDDPIWLRGVVLLENGPPVVVAALDWTGVLNDCHRIWTEALAEAAHTSPDRVLLHCCHQHNAPFVDAYGNKMLQKAGADSLMYDPAFFDDLVKRSAKAVRDSLVESQPITHIRHGQGTVEKVACNRRVIGPDGKIKYTRTSATKNPAARAEPEGTIDPVLRSIGFYQDNRPVARLYGYTTHPMSYYGDGRVSSDFVGLARLDREREEPETLHVYFTGCAGNITAGKYNDGSHENRKILADRVLAGMRAADRDADSGEARPFDEFRFTTRPIRFQAREDLDLDEIAALVKNPGDAKVNRNRLAMELGWLKRLETRRPILLGRLDLPGATMLHLPAETFVEYQLDAQQQEPGRFLFTAAYGDGGPWYIPLKRSYDEGGYEPSVSFVSRETEPTYRDAVRGLLSS